MWSCINEERLQLLQQLAKTGCITSAAEATVQLGTSLSTILVLLSRGEEAAKAAHDTLRACKVLGISSKEAEAQESCHEPIAAAPPLIQGVVLPYAVAPCSSG